MLFPGLEIEKNWDNTAPKSKSALLASLRGGAAAIDAIANSFPDTQWNIRPSESEWCMTEILCHLRDVEREINLVRVKTILQETQPFIAGIESDRWSIERDYLHQDCRDALASFLIARQSLIDHLETGHHRRLESRDPAFHLWTYYIKRISRLHRRSR